MWYVSAVARLRVVSASIDWPNLCLVIRFQREGEERLARWIGGEDWRERRTLNRLFAEAEPTDQPPVSVRDAASEIGVGPPRPIPSRPG